jgi:hypothetical protein
MKTFNDVFQENNELKNFREYLKQGEILNSFEDFFPDLKNIAKPVKIEKLVLFLKVENSVWRSELKFRQKIIIDKINEHFGQQVVKSLRFIA